MRKFGTLAAIGLCLVVASCGDTNPPASLEVFVLVDLSESWHNNAVDKRNQGVLEAIGGGIIQVAETKDPPVDVQYRPIGLESLGQEPLCDARYEAQLVSIGKKNRPGYLITKLNDFRTYLTTDCPELIVHRPVEALTRITAAIDTVAHRPRSTKTNRYIIIASDLFEENGSEAIPAVSDLHDTRVLLVYRPFEKVDGQNSEHLETRIQEWVHKLEACGATVKTIPDSGLKASDIAALMAQ